VECSGNRRLAAERLGIGLRTLYDKLRRYQLESLR
jgi:DNA-binding NtrC family response regulator